MNSVQMIKASRNLMEKAAMKTRNRINPTRDYLKLLALCVPLAWPVSATAAPITWGTATTIAADTDVSTAGTLAYAYHWNAGDQTVNGVTFTGTTSITNGGSDVDLAGFEAQYDAFTSGSNPFTSLSAAYQATLAGSPYNGGATVTVTLKNLTPGNSYDAQVWIEDARNFGSGRFATLTSSGGNSVVLDYCSTDADGGVGQYSIGTFTADAATQTFTIAASAGGSAQLNALQVRDQGASTPQAKIFAFGPGATIGPVAANAAAISWTVPFGSNKAALSPTFTLSDGATCTVGLDTPVSGETRDFTSPVHYIVKASDFATSGKTTDYTVTVVVGPPPGVWSYSAWTGDADSGITGDPLSYTAAANFGGAATTVNGVAFEATNGSGSNFLIGGGVVVFTTGAPSITGASLALASSFIYDGNPRTVTLSNLTPGATYETSLFAYGFDASGRIQTFASGSDSLVLDQDFYGQNQGIRIAYTFVADSSGSKVLTITPNGGSGTFHMSALANRSPTPQATITSFGPGATIGPVAANAAAISWTVPFGANVTALPATFTLSHGATCTVGVDTPVSGEPRDFTSPVHYIVKSSDFATSGKTTDYTVTVTVTPVSSAKDILSFGPGATISGTDITWFVPFGSDVTTLAPTYSVSTFASEDVSFPSGTARNFTTPQTYTITAQDGTTQTYTVTVTVAPDESTLIWNTGSGPWDLTSPNWKGQSSGVTMPFNNGQNVIFESTTGGTIAIAPGMEPASTTVSAASGTYTFSGGPLAGTGTLTKSGNGTLYLLGANTYTGGTTVNNGDLSLAAGSSAGSGTITLATGAALALSVGSMTISNPIIVTSGTAAIKQFAGGRYVFSGGVTGGTSGAQTLSLIQGAGGGNAERTTITVSGVIANGSGGTLGVSADFQSASTADQGAFICLSGLNTFTGPIVVNNSIGLIYDGGISSYHGAWFVIGGYITSGHSDRTTYPGTGCLGGGNYSNTISLATGTILNYMSSANQILGGAISGNGNIVKEGTGTLTLSGANLYTGATTIIAGTLEVSGSLESANIAVSATSTLVLLNTTCLSTNAVLRYAAGAANTLNYTGRMYIRALYTNDVLLPDGEYSSANLPAFITGTGRLNTGPMPPSGTVISIY